MISNLKVDTLITHPNSVGSLIISIVLGLGLSALFKKVCKQNCIVYKISNYDEIKGKVFEHEDKCYKFERVKSSCGVRKELIKEESRKSNN